MIKLHVKANYIHNMQYNMNTSYNTDSKLSLATLINTEEFKKASEKFWKGIPGKSECYPSEINTYNNKPVTKKKRGKY